MFGPPPTSRFTRWAFGQAPDPTGLHRRHQFRQLGLRAPDRSQSVGVRHPVRCIQWPALCARSRHAAVFADLRTHSTRPCGFHRLEPQRRDDQERQAAAIRVRCCRVTLPMLTRMRTTPSLERRSRPQAPQRLPGLGQRLRRGRLGHRYRLGRGRRRDGRPQQILSFTPYGHPCHDPFRNFRPTP